MGHDGYQPPVTDAQVSALVRSRANNPVARELLLHQDQADGGSNSGGTASEAKGG